MQKFVVIYPDGSRSRINTQTCKEMTRDGVLEPIDTNRFRYTGPVFRFRSFADLRILKAILMSSKRLKNYPGLFIRVYKQRRRKEVLEPPEKMALRLRAEGIIGCPQTDGKG